MNKIIKISDYKNILDRVSAIIIEARRKTVWQINTIITQTYWEIGRLVVEEEQKGKEKAKYGEELLIKLSIDLLKKFGKGFSVDNLESMRKFYLLYPSFEKSETLSRKSIKSVTSSRISLIREKRIHFCCQTEKNNH